MHHTLGHMPVDTKPAPASLTCAPLHSVCSRSLSCRQPITRACVRCGGATPRRCGFARSCCGLVLAVSQQHTCSRRIALACCSCGGAAVALRWRYASLLWLACLLLRLVLAAGRRRRCSHSLQATDRSLVCDATPCCCGFTGSRYGRVLLASQQHGCGPRLLCLAAVASPVRALASCLLGAPCRAHRYCVGAPCRALEYRGSASATLADAGSTKYTIQHCSMFSFFLPLVTTALWVGLLILAPLLLAHLSITVILSHFYHSLLQAFISSHEGLPECWCSNEIPL